MTVKTIPAVEARVHFGQIMRKSFKNGDCFLVEKSGIPMVAIINADDYAKLTQEREERFKILDKIKSKLPRAGEEEVRADVAQAIAQIRKKKSRA